MIHIKIYGKGKGMVHQWVKINVQPHNKSTEISALLLAVCQIMRSATGGTITKDELLETMGKAWDYKEDNDEQEGD